MKGDPGSGGPMGPAGPQGTVGHPGPPGSPATGGNFDIYFEQDVLSSECRFQKRLIRVAGQQCKKEQQKFYLATRNFISGDDT